MHWCHTVPNFEITPGSIKRPYEGGNTCWTVQAYYTHLLNFINIVIFIHLILYIYLLFFNKYYLGYTYTFPWND